MQIKISWLLQKLTDPDLHCLQRQDISRFSRTRVNTFCTVCLFAIYHFGGLQTKIALSTQNEMNTGTYNKRGQLNFTCMFIFFSFLLITTLYSYEKTDKIFVVKVLYL